MDRKNSHVIFQRNIKSFNDLTYRVNSIYPRDGKKEHHNCFAKEKWYEINNLLKKKMGRNYLYLLEWSVFVSNLEFERSYCRKCSSLNPASIEINIFRSTVWKTIPISKTLKVFFSISFIKVQLALFLMEICMNKLFWTPKINKKHSFLLFTYKTELNLLK